jgi:hypothetical protein
MSTGQGGVLEKGALSNLATNWYDLRNTRAEPAPAIILQTSHQIPAVFPTQKSTEKAATVLLPAPCKPSPGNSETTHHGYAALHTALRRSANGYEREFRHVAR